MDILKFLIYLKIVKYSLNWALGCYFKEKYFEGYCNT